MRINLGAAFRELFKGEEGGINVVFSYMMANLRCFIKTTRNLFSPYVRSRQDMRMDGIIALNVNVSTRRIVQHMI
jgi:hypothetical protein